MFEEAAPRVFYLAPGVDFPQGVVEGLLARFGDGPPEALARVQLIVNTKRMARRIRALFDAGPARLLPRIELLGSLGQSLEVADIPPAVPPLRRRLELTRLISELLDADPSLAPRAALFDLADSLAGLMDEMQGEGVPPEVIAALDVSDQSGHWQRTQSFLTIVERYFGATDEAPDAEARQRMVIERLAASWAEHPPTHPVILAGSTGSRGATHLLMQAVAKLPQGAVILPGFDDRMPDAVWSVLDEGDPDDPAACARKMPAEDHPQFRFRKLMTALAIDRSHLKPWHDTAPAHPARNAVISLALRPAPVTDQWLEDGPKLTDIDAAMAEVTLLEAPDARSETSAIAMRLRQAAQEGQTAALITPDRMLTRRVTAALDQWGIVPDDSAGMPLQLSPPGRFLRHVAALYDARPSAESLMTLLKHPLCHGGSARNLHNLLTRDLELYIRRKGWPHPDSDGLMAWAATQKDTDAALRWAQWICEWILRDIPISDDHLTARLDHHITRAEALAQGPEGTGSGALWDEAAGREAAKTVADLRAQAPYGGPIGARDYQNLFGAILARGEVRAQDDPHPHILIWGTLEARVQGADLLILAGLNEGSWPEAPTPDPWLNRKMRHDAGLLLPDRRIGLSAHDFEQAAAAPEVWFTRAKRSDDAETIASRWLNRLTNMLGGLPQQGGVAALEAMRARGAIWLSKVAALENVTPVPPSPRPSPKPPAAARPRTLSVTEIRHLVRDPYAIYAKHVLGLRPLNPLMRAPDAMMRGTVIHDVFEQFVKESRDDETLRTRARLLDIAREVLLRDVPWGETRVVWQSRIARVADWFLQTEAARRALARPAGFEISGQAMIAPLGFTLRGKADRIDLDPRGAAHIYDYKTGSPPSKAQQKQYDKQLLLEAAMVERGAFKDLAPKHVARAVYIGLGATPSEVEAPLDETSAAQIWAEFEELIASYLDENQGFTARSAMPKTDDVSDYDLLSRFGEWDITQSPDGRKVP